MNRYSRLILILLLMYAHTVKGETLTGYIIEHQIEGKSFAIGDIEQHNASVSEYRGLAILEDGEVATVTVIEFSDSTAGNGPYWGYETLTFDDNASIVSKFEGENTNNGKESITRFRGKQTYIRGTGRFSGISGKGTHEGANYDGRLDGAGTYLTFKANYELPKK